MTFYDLSTAKVPLVDGFDPLDPVNLADPELQHLSLADKANECAELQFTRCSRALSRLGAGRAHLVGPVGKYFSSKGWLDDDSLSQILSSLPPSSFASRGRDPGAAFRGDTVIEVHHLSISLWNANGLRTTTVHEVLSHCLSSTLLFITETWLLSPSLLPTDWMQYHVYGVPVPSANRGSMGVTALVSPSCPFPVSQLPSPNRYTLSLKVGPFRIHCLYAPPSLSTADFMNVLSSIPSLPNSFICGDFNARLGDLTGDALVSPRGAAMARWLADRSLTVLNGPLAHGIPTWVGFRDDREMSSIIDMFLTNASLMSPRLDIASDLSLGSDHRLLTLSFSFAQSSASESSSDTPDFTLHPRRLWNLSRLGEPDPCQLYQDTFRSSSAPLLSQLKRLVQHPPSSRPPIDDLNASLNNIIYRSLDSSVGDRPPRPSHWKKYWTKQLQDAADFRNRCYRRWRRAFGIDKVYWWHQHQQANVSFRQAVATAKRLSWQAFCKSLESDFTKAISKWK
ncbi:hypothetical protein G6F33_012753 [Rhizopus arrhizus]|nr:hypothetical protein G6F33_012753 [Rhizopus arrhizus]